MLNIKNKKFYPKGRDTRDSDVLEIKEVNRSSSFEERYAN